MPALPIIGAVAAVVGAGAAVAGTVGSLHNQSQALAAQREQFSYEKQLNTNAYARQRRDAIRAGRLAGGTILQSGENQGVGGSSALLGGLGSIQSQLDSNLSFLDTQHSLGEKASIAGSQANSYSAKANMWSGVSQLGMSLFAMSPEIKRMKF